MTHAIQTQGVRRALGETFAIQDLSLSVPEGAVYGFLGPNGSGKTTTIRLLLGMLRAERGEIRVLGRAIPAEASTALASIGYVALASFVVVPTQPGSGSLRGWRRSPPSQSWWCRWSWR